jgi:hypothetical protein
VALFFILVDKERKMKRADIKRIESVAEGLGWIFSIDLDGDFLFQKNSPAGQDFSVVVGSDETGVITGVMESLNTRYEEFDCSEEAYIWLDDSGHGKNGAPHDMKDVYEDMEACKAMLGELVGAIDELVK